MTSVLDTVDVCSEGLRVLDLFPVAAASEGQGAFRRVRFLIISCRISVLVRFTFRLQCLASRAVALLAPGLRCAALGLAHLRSH